MAKNSIIFFIIAVKKEEIFAKIFEMTFPPVFCKLPRKILENLSDNKNLILKNIGFNINKLILR